MKRRNFVKMFGAAAVLSTAIGALGVSAADTTAAVSNSELTFSQVNAIVTSGRDKPAELVFLRGVPQQVPGALKPLAIAFDDGRRPGSVRMTLYRVLPNGKLKEIQSTFAGRTSTQNIMTYGVSISMQTVSAKTAH